MTRLLLLPIFGALCLSGCARPYPMWFDSDDQQAGIVGYSAEQRGQILVREPYLDGAGKPLSVGGSLVYRYKSLSENPPDVVMQRSIEAALKAEYAGVSGEARLKFGETALALGQRTERVNLLRDTLFALNQALFNKPDMDGAAWTKAYTAVVTAVLTATLADAHADATMGVQRAAEEQAAVEVKISEKLRQLKSLLGATEVVADGASYKLFGEDTTGAFPDVKNIDTLKIPQGVRDQAVKLIKEIIDLQDSLPRLKKLAESLKHAANNLTESISSFLKMQATKPEDPAKAEDGANSGTSNDKKSGSSNDGKSDAPKDGKSDDSGDGK